MTDPYPNQQNNPAAATPVYLCPSGGGSVQTTLDVTTATIIKAAPGAVLTVNVVVAGSSVGTVNDCLTTGTAAAANQVGTIPEGVGNYPQNFPCLVGIVVVPGTGQTLAVSFQ